MSVLEKILDEIDNMIDENHLLIQNSDSKRKTMEKISETTGLLRAKNLVINYLNNISDEDNKVLAGDWVPCSVRMPKANEKVDVTFREWMQYSKKYRYGTCNAVYFPKYTVKAEDVWTDYEYDDCVDYDEKTDTVYAEEGWYETIEHWGYYSHCYINCEVIAWRPLPERYKPDPESADGKRQREREEFFTEYKDGE